MASKTTVAAQIVDICYQEGADRVFSVPGESFLDIINEIYLHESMRFISCRHESGAAFMAEAYGKVTNKPGVVMATRGVGASNAAIGIHTAYQDSTPLVVFLGQVERSCRGREGFQEIDLDRMFSPVAKWTYELQDANRTSEMVHRAFHLAQSGRPGPVVISVPQDVLKEEIDETPYRTFQRLRPCPNADDLKKAAACLRDAKRPLIIAGGGICRSQAEKDLLTFAQRAHIPVIASFRRHDVMPNHHPLYVGHSGLGTFPNILDTIKQADTILAVGTRLSDITTQHYSVISERTALIHIDIEANVFARGYVPELAIVADASEALKALSACPWEKNHAWIEWAKQRRRVFEHAAAIVKNPSKHAVHMPQIIQGMQQVLPEDTVVTNDAGNFAGWLHHFYQFQKPKTYIGPTSGAMGYGFPAAVAAKMIYPDRTVISLSGDGGFMMTMQELETAVRYNTAVIAIVFNNCMYGTIRMHQEKVFPHHVLGTTLTDTHYHTIANAVGAVGWRVDNDQAFAQRLEEALQYTKQHRVPVVLEVMCEPEQISVSSTIARIREAKKDQSSSS
ncbi:acetolactate synthase-1/2/3 large subunit [Alteribacillus persepolensis]|uniref:Acetolactate synthase-1/2/3 large subunit n=1 Tax=Alteribacillus persepolensis TaxID=568899 RepID=A0A1G7Z3E9_9BACI|nr:thiamine pyrophosphate-dependent enzyme [Alteribacillus persepolensis]SDH03292.1 acetolactate synthase-1/2/3 large subunit [Alteribacillus persepolensis]